MTFTPVVPGLGVTWRDESNGCVFEYLYRDASNFKQYGCVLLAGDLEPGDDRLIRDALVDGEFSIPEQVGLEPLQHRFAEYSGVPTEDDHVWHEFVALRRASADERARLPCLGQKQRLLAGFQAADHWDERHSKIYGDLVEIEEH